MCQGTRSALLESLESVLLDAYSHGPSRSPSSAKLLPRTLLRACLQCLGGTPAEQTLQYLLYRPGSVPGRCGT